MVSAGASAKFNKMDHLDALNNYFNGLPAEDRQSYINKLTLSSGVSCPTYSQSSSGHFKADLFFNLLFDVH